MTRGRANGLACALVITIAWVAPVRAQVAAWPSERPPSPLETPDVRFPEYQIKTLANGLRVVAVPHHEQPAVSLRLLVEAGGAQDPIDKPGVANMTALLLDQGTTTRSAQAIAVAIDNIGGALGVGAGTDLTFVNAVVMKDSLDFVLDLVSDVARNPAFSPEEIERQRQQLLSSLQVSYEDPEYIAGMVFDRLVYGFHPYGRPSSGTAESVPTITRSDLRSFHARYFVPNNAILAIVGDVSPAEAFAGAERAFGGWARGDVSLPGFDEPPPPTRRVVVVDKPGAVQTEIRVGHLGVARKSPDYTALDLAIKVLGGEGANRLHRVLRSERGLTYGASADLQTLKQSGDFLVETNTRSETTGEALRLIVEEFWRLRRERVNRAELEGAQAYLAGSFPITIETPSAIALQVLNALFYGLDLDDLEHFPERVNAVTPGDIQRVAERYLKPDRLSIVLVGDADRFVSQLRGAGFREYERVPLPELDLDTADLKRRPRAATDRAPVTSSDGTDRATPAGTQRGRELVERAITASGGVETLRAIRTVKATATTTLSTPQGPLDVETVTYIEYPERLRIEASLPTGQVVQVYSDGKGWLKDPNGVREAPAPMLEDLRANVTRDLVSLLLRVHDGQAAVTAVPETTGQEGPQLPSVEITGVGPDPITLRFDPDSGHVAIQEHSVTGPGGAREVVELQFSDYRAVEGGARIPFTAKLLRQDVVQMQRVLTACEINVQLDPGLFTRPS